MRIYSNFSRWCAIAQPIPVASYVASPTDLCARTRCEWERLKYRPGGWSGVAADVNEPLAIAPVGR